MLSVVLYLINVAVSYFCEIYEICQNYLVRWAIANTIEEQSFVPSKTTANKPVVKKDVSATTVRKKTVIKSQLTADSIAEHNKQLLYNR